MYPKHCVNTDEVQDGIHDRIGLVMKCRRRYQIVGLFRILSNTLRQSIAYGKQCCANLLRYENSRIRRYWG